MDKLEQLLRNPASHSDVPSSEQVRIWSEKALERWSIENQDGVPALNPTFERLKDLVYRVSLVACLLFLSLVAFSWLNSAWGNYDTSALNLPTGSDVTLMLSKYSNHLAIVICATAILATRPLREFLLDQLS